MKIFSWNVNGIRAVIKKGELQNFIKFHQPDVLCLQETKAKQGQAEIDLPDYEEFWNDADRPGYSGTAIFVKNNIIKSIAEPPASHSEHQNSHSGLDPESSNLRDQYGDLTREGRITTLEFDKFFLVTVYTPNSKGDLSRLDIRQKWDAAFLKYLNELHQTKPVIFCGDLNVAHREIDLANPKQNVGKHGFTDQERAGFQAYLDAGYTDIYRDIHGDLPNQYTWWSHWARARERNIGWRIDYFLVSTDIYMDISAAGIHPKQQGSDHCPISITLGEK
ncbi:MAG: exodeoxyribonuclease III [Candidatus Nomurabacteria bacterium]|jgi:exodeoxyribonuclease-3|nr:exodeoxyribonuclease III [Candidatus Nomurabacteria bacterium]